MSFLRTPLGKLCLYIVLLLLGIVAVVWFFDPFYQYHQPFPGMKAVLNDRDNQMPGTVRNFAYDSVLVGSSVAENFDSSYLDEHYDCHTLKIIRASGSVADLLYYLEMAQEERELKNVFWCLDLFALEASTEVTLYGDDTPRYLHTETVLDDTTYLLNKEVLLEKIPFMLASAYLGRNTDGQAYDWSHDKEFGAAKAMQAYQKPTENLEEQDFSQDIPVIAQNIESLALQISSHPDTRYRILFPPYSMMWWDCAKVNGNLEKQFYILEQVMPVLLSLPNVEVYYFQDEEAIVCNLDNYMDMIHYTPQVNQYMLEQMVVGEKQWIAENWEDKLQEMRGLADRIISTEIYRYYPEPHKAKRAG